jgi:hypothetical protein
LAATPTPEATHMTDALEVEMVHLAEVARRVVALGYARSMTGCRVGRLAASDPAWPVASDQEQWAGNRRLVPWEPVRAYFAARDSRPGPKGWPRPTEWVTLAEVARRAVTDLGYPSMSGQTLGKLARTDPAWPVPRAQWCRVGPYWQVPWPPVRDYLTNRDTRQGPKGWPRSRRHPGSSDAAPSTPSKERPVSPEPWTSSSEAARGTAVPLPPPG